mmetsp:Transcript_632/g.1881  ORF Transcript_632/g.1881 Transcript_632/m.1881 type:complete len:263 (-) Transcript_632:919-1707(-)
MMLSSAISVDPVGLEGPCFCSGEGSGGGRGGGGNACCWCCPLSSGSFSLSFWGGAATASAKASEEDSRLVLWMVSKSSVYSSVLVDGSASGPACSSPSSSFSLSGSGRPAESTGCAGGRPSPSPASSPPSGTKGSDSAYTLPSRMLSMSLMVLGNDASSSSSSSSAPRVPAVASSSSALGAGNGAAASAGATALPSCGPLRWPMDAEASKLIVYCWLVAATDSGPPRSEGPTRSASMENERLREGCTVNAPPSASPAAGGEF